MVTTLLLLVDFGPMASSLVVVVRVSQRDAHVPWDQLAAGKAVPERTMSSSLSILRPFQFELLGHRDVRVTGRPATTKDKKGMFQASRNRHLKRQIDIIK